MKEAQAKQKSFTALATELLEPEVKSREIRAAHNRLKRARLPEDWTLDTFPYARQPSVSRAHIKQLAELEFLREAVNICFIGDVGVGKTGLAIGVTRAAIEAGHSAMFWKVSELVDYLYASVLDRSTQRVIRRLANIDVLVLDEFAYISANEEQANLLFKLIDARYRRKPTLFTSNLGYDDWPTVLPKRALASALIDRVTDQCHVIRIEGPSLRGGERKSPTPKS
jgi:DNA replication protein DnaC